MTEIRVEQKRNRATGPGLLLLIIPLMWFAMSRNSDRENERAAADTALTTGTAAGDVAPSAAAATASPATPTPDGPARMIAPERTTRDTTRADSTVDTTRVPAVPPDTTRPPAR